MKVITVANIKGGVGKSMLSYALALYYNSEMNFGVKLLDLDAFNISLMNLLYQTEGNYELRHPKIWNDRFSDATNLELDKESINIIDVGANRGLSDHFTKLLEISNLIIVPTTIDTESVDVTDNVMLKDIYESGKDIKVVLIFNARDKFEISRIDELKNKLLIKYPKLEIIKDCLRKIPSNVQESRFSSAFNKSDYIKKFIRMEAFRELIRVINYNM